MTHLQRHGRVVGVTKVVGLVPQSAGNVLAIREKARSGKTNVLVDRLYPPVRALDQKLRVEKALNTQDDTVLAADTDGDTKYVSEERKP